MLPTKFQFIWERVSDENFFLEINQSETSFVSFGQAVSEEKIKKNQPIRNKNYLWWPCLLMDRDNMCNLNRGPSIDASHQISVHLAEGFQRRRLKCEKLTDDGCQVMAKAHVAFGKVS
jgi:hypothetical protein